MVENLKKNLLSVFALLLVVIGAIAIVPADSAQAAVSWPSVSSSAYVEMIAQSSVPMYTSSSLSSRGTADPYKQYSTAQADKGDMLKIYKITSSYTYLAYPASGVYKKAYCSTSALFGVTAPSSCVSSQGSASTYKYAGSTSYGSIAKNDSIYKLRTSGSYTLCIYTAKSGSRAWKCGWVNTGTLNSITGNVSRVALSYGLYQNTSAYISCGFDGYVNTAGRHEGIDIHCGNGKSIYALTSGVVTRVTFGSTGSSGLSTIAIYNSAADKTVIYLHSAPTSSLYVGQSISKGQYLGTESWRGVSSSSGSHTHVEVRNGKQTAACKSVNDSRLDNANPTSFWNGQGYDIR